MEESAFDVVVVGSINMDFVSFTDTLPAPGQTVSGHSFSASPGGKGANQAVAASRLGSRTALIGCVGGDTIGNTLLDSLTANRVDCAGVRVEAASASGVAMIVVDASGANSIVVVGGGNALVTADDIAAHESLIARAAIVVLQLEIPLAVTLVAAQTARRLGKTVVLNPAPAQALPAELLACVDYLVPNESEAQALSGVSVTSVESAMQAARVLRQQGADCVIVTLGDKGVVALTSRGVRHHAAQAVRPVDTTAAGDTFIGGLCCGLAAGLALADAIALGQAAAAVSVTRKGAQESIPYRAELKL
jgi:ribokinase